jgi:hypothetical protein
MLLSSETLEVTSMILFFANAKNKNKEYEDWQELTPTNKLSVP